MKKLFSSTLSFLTAMTLVSANSAIPAFADAIDTVPIDADIAEDIYIGDIADLEIPYPDTPAVTSNFSDGTYNYSQFLDENNTLVYNAMKPLVSEPSVTPINVKLKDPVSVTLSTLPSSPNISDEELETYQLALFGCCKPGIDSFTLDYPELCWLDVTKIAVRPGDDTYISRSARKGTYTIKIYSVTITPDYYDGFGDFDAISGYLDKIQDAVDTFEVNGDTRYEQIKSIHDQIALNTYYDLGSKFRGSAIGALVEPGVVCEGYAKAFKMICDSINIPCVVVFGNYDPAEDAAHMWNYILMDDNKWYAIDVTWDDLDGENGLEIKYDYFIRGSKRFNTNHTPETDYNITQLTYPEIEVSDYKFSSSSFTTTATTTTTPTTSTTPKATTTTSPTTSTTTKATSTTSPTTSTTTKATTTTSPTTSITTKATTTTSKTTSTTTKATTTTSKTTSTTTKAATTTSKTTSTTTKATTTTSKTTSTTTKATTTTSKTTSTTTKATTTTSKTTSTTTKATTTTSKTTSTTTKATTTTTSTSAAPLPIVGDLNRDGKVNVADLVYCADTVLGRIDPENSCDVNNDKNTDVFDVIYMRKLIINLIK